MPKIAFALAVALAATSSALAYEDAAPVSTIENSASITLETKSPKLVRSGDAAPAVVIVNAPATMDFSSAAAIGATSIKQVSPRVFGGSN